MKNSNKKNKKLENNINTSYCYKKLSNSDILILKMKINFSNKEYCNKYSLKLEN